ncbi:hypothetical protein NM208_g14577 [Fusarium decemcellulare]|uniref:Uncharacterized protein n=1 Tax=Fusarium decemcellulare TaxID=57161 RepID=A0ACC1RGY1_9HYPO|nr:hypothetical protein NM208_g14577 [Fusarium decemcellulare]
MTDSSTHAYTLERGTGFLQRMWYLYHQLGIWSNILVSAEYTNEHGDQLDKAVILDSLQTVVEAHPALWQVFVKRPSSKKGQHALHTGVLRTIDLEKCVEYLDDESSVTSDDLERAHNEWLWNSHEPDRPLWKLQVKGRNIIFVYHHSLGDGMSGMVFHREFLAALNSHASTKTKARQSTILHVKDPAHMPLDPEQVWDGKDSILELIWTQLVWLFMTVYYGSARIYGNLPPSKPHLSSATAIAGPDQRTVTRISSYRIPADKMALIIDACREHQTTFTPLLITMLLIVLATEFYPDAKVGATRYNFDLRPILPMSQIGGGTINGTFANAAASWQSWHKLGSVRRVLSSEGGSSLDAEAVWKLVKDKKDEMTDAISGKGVRNWSGIKRLGTDLEDIVNQAFPSVSFLLKPTFSVSNIGAFSEIRVGGEKPGPWQIDDLQFSAGAVRGTQGTHGAIFHVGGVKGGNTTINATYEDSIVPREMAEGILERTVARILEVI